MGDVGLMNVIDGLIYGMTVVAFLAVFLTIPRRRHGFLAAGYIQVAPNSWALKLPKACDRS